MNVNQLINLIELGYEIKRPVLALSSPGIGKSSSFYQAVSKLSTKHNQTFHAIEVRASTSNPGELGDIKAVINGEVKDIPQGWIPTDEKVQAGLCAESGGVLIDEISDGTPAVQSAFQQLLLDRRLGSARLAKGWFVMAATNRVTDRAAAGRLSTALINRCITVTVEVDTGVFVSWALDNDLAMEVIAYCRWRPGCWNFDPKARNENPAFCSPRSMHIASDILKAMPKPDLEVLSGAVGDAVGSELFGFLQIMNELPNLDLIEKDPDAVRPPKGMDVGIATIYALMARINEKNANNILRFFAKCDTELAVLGVRDLLEKQRELVARQPAFREWVQKEEFIRLMLN